MTVTRQEPTLGQDNNTVQKRETQQTQYKAQDLWRMGQGMKAVGVVTQSCCDEWPVVVTAQGAMPSSVLTT
jgi:hypothetical protein